MVNKKITRKFVSTFLSVVMIVCACVSPAWAAGIEVSPAPVSTADAASIEDLVISNVGTDKLEYNIEDIDKTATVSYTIDKAASMVVQIYKGDTWLQDLVLFEEQTAGEHSVEWNFDGYDAGDYRFVVFTIDNDVTVAKEADFKLTFTATNIDNAVTSQPSYDLDAQNKTATVSYNIDKTSDMVVQIYKGDTWIKDLVLFGEQSVGTHSVIWDYSGNDAGDYHFVVFTIDNGVTVAKEANFKLTFTATNIDNAVTSQPSYDLDAQGKTATVSYNIDKTSDMVVQIYKGDTWIKDLVLFEEQTAGDHSAEWNFDGYDTGDYHFVIFTIEHGVTVAKEAHFQLAVGAIEITNVTKDQESYDTEAQNKTATVSYTINKAASMVVQLYKGDTWIKDLVLFESQTAGTHSVTWDYSGNDAGDYHFVIFTNNSGTIVSQELDFTLTFKTVVISGATTDNASYDIEEQNKTATVSYTIDKAASMAVQVYKGDTWIQDLVLFESQTAGTHSVTWDYSGNDAGDYHFVIFSTKNGETVSVNVDFALIAISLEITNADTDSDSYYTQQMSSTSTLNYALNKSSEIVVQLYRGDTWLNDLVLFEKQTVGVHTVKWDFTNQDAGNYKFIVYGMQGGKPSGVTEIPFSLVQHEVAFTNTYLNKTSFTPGPTTTLLFNYTLTKDASCTAQIYSADGQKWIADLFIDKGLSAGDGNVEWQMNNAAPGKYKVRLFTRVDGVTLIKESEPFTVVSGPLKGIDVSTHNNKIDWKKVAATDVDYAMIRDGYGRYIKNPDNGKSQIDDQLANNVSGAKSVGMPFGLYHYSYATDVEGAIAEAYNCLEILKRAGITPADLAFPLTYDIEEENVRHSERKQLNTEMCNAFTKVIKDHGYKTMVYADRDFYTNYLNVSQLTADGIWMAAYTSEPGNTFPIHMWQYTSTGRVDGIYDQNGEPGNVDLNICYSTDFNGVIPSDTNAYCNAEGPVNVRNAPGTTGTTIIDKLYYGDRVKILESAGSANGFEWSKIQFNGKIGYVATKYLNYPG